MNKSVMFKSIVLLLVTLLCLLFAAACGGSSTGGKPAVTSGAPAATAVTTAAAEPEKEPTKEELVAAKLDELAAGKSFSGEELRFFSRSKTFHSVWYSYEIYAEEERNEPINDAVYRRNRVIEDKFGVAIKETPCLTKNLAAEMRTLILADDKSNDVFMPPFTVAGVLAGEELFYDLYELPNLDLTSPWWDRQEVESLSLYGSLYFAIGDISVLDKVGTRGVYFNKGLIKDFALDDPYKLVADNEWTVEKMYEMMQVVAKDTNSDGIMDNSDRHGLMIENNSLQNMMNAMGGETCVLNDAGEPEIAFMSDKTQSVLSKLFSVLYDTDTVFNYESPMYKRTADYGKTDERLAKWSAGTTLFWETCFDDLETFRGYDIEFGILPCPKADTTEPWHSAFYVDAPSLVCVPITNTELEKAGTVLEALCAESSITLMPAYYDVCIEGKYTRDEQSVEMLDIIFSSRTYDLGIIFKLGNVYTKLVGLASSTSTNVASTWASIETAFRSDLDKVIDVYS